MVPLFSFALQGTYSTGGSTVARPDGIIRFFDCGLLVVIQPNAEGGSYELVKYYDYRDVSSPLWYTIYMIGAKHRGEYKTSSMSMDTVITLQALFPFSNDKIGQ